MKIGVIGGMGPRATVEFEKRLVDKFSGADQEIPPILVINDGSIPDRTQFLLGNGDDPVAKINQSVEVLLSWGADYMCLPCNTACSPAILGRINGGERIINLQKEVSTAVGKRNIERVYLLGTRGTVQFGEYDKLLKREGVHLVEQNEEIQVLTDRCIFLVKSGKVNQARAVADDIDRLIMPLRADSVILGCTELSYVKKQIPRSIDSLDVLADTMFELARDLRYE